jgi:hypothetical protein
MRFTGAWMTEKQTQSSAALFLIIAGSMRKILTSEQFKRLCYNNAIISGSIFY